MKKIINSFYSEEQLQELGLKKLGRNVKISAKASLYNTDQMEIGDNSRIDDFCVISGKISIGKNVHIAPMCLVAGAKVGVYFEDFSGISYGVQVFSQSDDYSGGFLTGPTIPAEYKRELKSPVFIRKHVIVGASSVILPGVDLAEGCSVGAMSLVTKSTQPWTIVVGIPARILKSRHKDLLKLEEQYLCDSLK